MYLTRCCGYKTNCSVYTIKLQSLQVPVRSAQLTYIVGICYIRSTSQGADVCPREIEERHLNKFI